MKALLRRAYAGILRLYPAAFRRAFGEEMQAVFDEALEARDRSPARVTLRELADLPAGLLAAWGWSLRHREQLAPRLWLAADGIPGGSIPVRSNPAPWRQALLAGLPFLLLGLASGLPGLLNQPETAPVFRVTLLGPLILAGVGSLAWSALRGWLRWAAGWYLLWMALLLYPLSMLSSVGSSFYQNFILTVFLLAVAWLLYRIARRDRIAAVLAGLPAMLVPWLPFMEQTPMTIIPASLRGATFLSLFVLSGLGAVIFLRANRLEIALALAFLASALGGGLAAYAGIYFGGMLSFSEPGPSPRAALEAFLPALFLSASIAVGPQLARNLRDVGLRAGRWGRVCYRVALLGLLLMLVTAILVTQTLTGGGFSAPGGPAVQLIYRLLAAERWDVLRWIVCLAIYLAGFGGLAFSAERMGVLLKAGILALLFVLPLGVPAALVNSVNVYMGWVGPYRWAINAALLVWLAGSVWLIMVLSKQKIN